MRHAVVVFDPSGNQLDGEVISGNAIGVAQARGVALLPVELELLRHGGVSGYSKRSYGRGWRYNPVGATRGCPLVLHVSAGFDALEWCARILPETPPPAAEGEVAEPLPLGGSIRMAPDTAQVGAGAIGISPETPAIQLQLLGPPDAAGGWTVTGRARMGITGDMFLALQLYGQMAGARVVWFAASQTR